MDKLDRLLIIVCVLIGFAAGCADTRSIASVAAESRLSYTDEGDRDIWRVCGHNGKGDCEDMALCAIVNLRKRGIAATLGVYKTPGQPTHAVAIVGDWLIDNGTMRPRNHQKFMWEGELRGNKVWMTKTNGKPFPPRPVKDVIGESS